MKQETVDDTDVRYTPHGINPDGDLQENRFLKRTESMEFDSK